MEGCLLLARLELLSGGTDAQAADMNLQTICKLSEKLYFFLEGKYWLCQVLSKIPLTRA